MSRLVARILLTIVMFPLASLTYLALFICFETQQRTSSGYSRNLLLYNFVFCGMSTWFGVAGYWFLIWRGSVNWTRSRIMTSVFAVGGAALAGVILGAIVGAISDREVGWFIASTLSPLFWLFCTVFIWRETDSERARRLIQTGSTVVVCPACGYNLTGLKEARCPECGAQYTLNELLAAQPQRAAADLENDASV